MLIFWGGTEQVGEQQYRYMTRISVRIAWPILLVAFVASSGEQQYRYMTRISVRIAWPILLVAFVASSVRQLAREHR